ncbi:chaperone protein dnaJ 11, chloroplastic-like [Lotus japonicus]|uniref:chaperone protein dnaJ 11, chloroplastic-like n=1 Tax=Lotus japonicus TaxID=34305 RepID=UPI002590AD7C|nr:chaperone protein dnaJ 11, chloroplastic-like [Lotus japonicus]
MLSPSFTTATTFSGQIATSPTGHVRSRPVLAFATATEADYRPTPSLHLSTHGDSGMASCSSSLYEILGIAAAASDQEIKAAYRRLARVRHPNVAAVDRKDSSADEFMKIHAAYSTLSDPEKRASYDRSMNRRRRPLTAAVTSRFSGYKGRNWETDQCW